LSAPDLCDSTPRPAGGCRPRRLRTHLLILVLVVLMPALAVGAVAVWQAAAGYRAASEARLRDTARALTLAVDGEIGRAEAPLTVLASVPDLDDGGDLAAFERRARLVAAALGASVVLFSPDQRRVLDTSLSAGGAAPAADPPAGAAVAQVFGTGRMAVGVVDPERPAGQRRPAVLVPAMRAGRVAWVVGMVLSPVRLSALLAAQRLSDGEFAALADARGILVARSHRAEQFVGQPAQGWYQAVMADPQGAALKASSLEGEEVLLAAERLRAAPGWAVAVATPYAAHIANWRTPLQGLAFGAIAALTLAATLAVWLAQRLLRPVQALADGARAVAAEGDSPALAVAAARSNVAEFETLRLCMADADAALRQRAAAERQTAAALHASELRERELRAEFLRVARVSEMGQMAATLAHELNQPLAAVTNYLNGARRLLERADDQPPLAAARHALTHAASASVRAGQIVRRMHGLAVRGETIRRIETPAGLIEEASELALILAKHAGVQVRLELDRTAPAVLVDRVQIQQALLNLMHNAIEAMGASDGERTLVVTLRGEEDGRVAIAVADTGPGLPDEVQAELFAPFVTTKPDGVGIGLSVSRTIVEAHGGRIWAEPNPGGGMVFRLTLPAAAATAMEDAGADGA
jgi:C4-dicarboxylate-specific signal transduction histidine kinase